MKKLLFILGLISCITVFSQEIKTETVYKYEIKGKKQIKHKSVEKTYNTNGKKIKEVSFNEDESIKKIKEYKYNKNGEITEEIIKTADGSITKKTIWEYKNGNLVSKTVFDSNGNIKSKKEYTYTFY